MIGLRLERKQMKGWIYKGRRMKIWRRQFLFKGKYRWCELNFLHDVYHKGDCKRFQPPGQFMIGLRLKSKQMKDKDDQNV